MKEFFAIESTTNESTKNDCKSITIMTYNTLAQTLMNRRTSFKYISKTAGRWKNRRQLLLDEISDCNADVICCQEMDFFEDFWGEELDKLGYSCIHQPKVSSHKDSLKLYGLTIAFKSDKFEMVEYKLVEYQNLANDLKGVKFFELCKSNVAQICALRMKDDTNSKDSKQAYHIIVANTHAFWRFNYSYTRLRQLCYLMQEIKEINKNRNWPVVIMGDFNMVPSSMVYSLLTNSQTRKDVLDLDPDDTQSLKQSLSEFLLPKDILQNTSLQEIVELHNHQALDSVDIKEEAQEPIQEQRELEQLERKESAKRRKSVDRHDLEWWLNRVHYSLHDHSIFDTTRRLNHVHSLIKEQMNKESFPMWYSVFSNYTQLDREIYPVQMRDIEWEKDCNEPPFTTYNDGWCGTVDYMMLLRDDDTSPMKNQYPSHIAPYEISKIPKESELTEDTAIPSEKYGSDHVPLIARFYLRLTPITEKVQEKEVPMSDASSTPKDKNSCATKITNSA